MKTATIREVKAKLSEFIELARHDLVVITRHGRAAAVWRGIDPDDLEEVLYERSERFRSLITARRATRRQQRVPLGAVAPVTHDTGPRRTRGGRGKRRVGR